MMEFDPLPRYSPSFKGSTDNCSSTCSREQLPRLSIAPAGKCIRALYSNSPDSVSTADSDSSSVDQSPVLSQNPWRLAEPSQSAKKEGTEERPHKPDAFKTPVKPEADMELLMNISYTYASPAVQRQTICFFHNNLNFVCTTSPTQCRSTVERHSL